MKINDILNMSNKKFSVTIKVFKEHCEKAGVKPTARQASKWRRKVGRAYQAKEAR